MSALAISRDGELNYYNEFVVGKILMSKYGLDKMGHEGNEKKCLTAQQMWRQ